MRASSIIGGSFLLPAVAAFVAIAPSSKRSTPMWSSLDAGDLKSSAQLSSVPFFAASSSSSTQQTGSAPTTATVTLRLPLGTIFDGRDYIFVTESNVRSYEWTTREADLLMDDLIDAASLGGGGDGGVIEGVGQIIQPVMDYELSQIVVVPTSDWDSNEFGLGNKYDVHDGQQRLVTLNLLLAGLRDIFRREAEDLNARGGLGGKKAVALAATAHEISGMLMPTKVRKSDVLRITLRRRDNVLLERILIGSVDDSDAKADRDDVDDDIIAGGESSMFTASLPEIAMISYKYPQMSTKDKTTLLSSLSPANSRIFHNFVHLTNRLVSLTTRERLRLLDYIVERVHLLVCIPETSRIARNIVLSQQGRRKGMDNEPIDDFKGLVCFRYTLDEDEMYLTFDSWDILAAEPAKIKEDGTSDDLAASSKAHSVGRDVLTSSCLLRASAALRTKIRSSRDRGGGDEVYEWERWLRRQLLLKNSQGKTEWQGKDFFVEEIEPSAIALYKFRSGQWDEFSFLSKTSTRKQRDTTVARMNFVRELMLGNPSAKEVEIAVLELLVRIEYGGDSSMLSRYLDDILPLMEKTALWMALTRPSAMQRHAYVLTLLDAMDDFDSVGAKASDDNGIVTTSLKDSMDSYDFGSTAAGKKLATAILRRMNAHLMIEEKKTVPEACSDVSTVDLIQQHWTSEEGEGLSHRIGNLALVSSSEPRNGRAKKGSGSTWEIKTKRYKKEPWILTRQVADSDKWDVAEVHAQQKDVLQLVEYVWS